MIVGSNRLSEHKKNQLILHGVIAAIVLSLCAILFATVIIPVSRGEKIQGDIIERIPAEVYMSHFVSGNDYIVMVKDEDNTMYMGMITIKNDRLEDKQYYIDVYSNKGDITYVFEGSKMSLMTEEVLRDGGN